MAGAIQISLSSHFFFGPESHLQAAEILLPGLFSVVHLPSQCIHQHSALGFLGPMGSPWLGGEQSHTSIGTRDWGSPVWQMREELMGAVFRGALTEEGRVGEVGKVCGAPARVPEGTVRQG